MTDEDLVALVDARVDARRLDFGERLFDGSPSIK